MEKNSSIRKTQDGSTTLYSTRFSQHYHNPNGAVSESRYIFFEMPGVPDSLKSNNLLVIFEVGFGTGLNLILLMDYLQKQDFNGRVLFESIEAYPIDTETVENLHFGDDLEYLNPRQHLTDIIGNLDHGMNRFEITKQITLRLYHGTFQERFSDDNIETNPGADFIFHDPFSPEVNAELWKPDVFSTLREIAEPDAILTTYCAASSARAAMVIAGWKVARAPGALGKREMTIASADGNRLSPFKRVNEPRLKERYIRGEFD